ncbi:hypothetical protein NYE27_26990 [Paenibacillus sp. FSL R10-2779]|uniref:hypothetical protein n=1 Tax=Paenibacillus sp. FSL R10-2779 TaxID=2975340 RepID=UPI0030FCC9EB
MKLKKIDRLTGFEGWFLEQSGDFYNPESKIVKRGNIHALFSENLTPRKGIVFDGQNKIINPYYIEVFYNAVDKNIDRNLSNDMWSDNPREHKRYSDEDAFINSAIIKYIFRTKLKKDVWYHIQTIHKIFENSLPLSKSDWEPVSSKNKYPRWKRKVHAVLSNLKKEDLIEHDEESNSYKILPIFVERVSSFEKEFEGFDVDVVKLKRKSKSYTNEEAAAILQFEHERFDEKKSYDIFLSHSSLDYNEILLLSDYLQSSGYSVYVDWLIDKKLDRNNVTSETAIIIRNRMKRCKCLLFAASNNSNFSRWMPWELGFFDGKGGKIAIIHVNKKKPGLGSLTGQEYLDIYEYVRRLGQEMWVHKTANNYLNFSEWLSS